MKLLTKECGRCSIVFLDIDSGKYVCRWGKCKKTKHLDNRRVLNKCNLKR